MPASVSPGAAAARGDLPGVQKLVMQRGKNRASVNQKDKEGFAPLHRAAEAGHAHIVKVLVERGANVDVATDTGFTALCLAAKEGYEPIVRILANAGANVERADLAYGCTPLLWACQNARGAEVTKFLCEKGADTATKSRVSNRRWRAWPGRPLVGTASGPWHRCMGRR